MVLNMLWYFVLKYECMILFLSDKIAGKHSVEHISLLTICNKILD